MDFSNFYKKTEQYVTNLFDLHQPTHRSFHKLEHTKSVVNKTNEIAAHYELSEKDMLIVFIAAWFHDTGYFHSEAHGHEEKSIEIMKEFMAKYAVPEEISVAVEGCIRATIHPRNPTNLLQEIICDADTYHFGTKEFKRTNKQMLSELQHYSKSKLSEGEFLSDTLQMLEHHHFYTSYCKDLLTESKKENIKKLKKREVKKVAEEIKDAEIDEKSGTTKGMQTMLRLTSSNHIQLSEMADQKANILISVNAIIISVILSVLLRKLQTDPYLTIPTFFFLAISVATIVVAILATRPKLSAGTFNEEDIVNKKTNLLFFGNFHKMQQEQYEKAMKTMMQDSDYLYSSIIQDIYHLGTVLGRKYKLVRLAYNIFMIGIILSVIIFAIAALFNDPAPSTAVVNSTGSPF